jgi:chaperone modulatory protein CbpM
MKKQEFMVVVDYSEDSPLTLSDICEMCHISPDYINELIAFDIVQPRGEAIEQWHFDLTHLRRIKTALRLQHDLEVNLAGIAVVLDLMEEIEDLRARAELLEKHFLR